LFLLAASSIVAFAQHPTGRNLRRAIQDTLPFIG